MFLFGSFFLFFFIPVIDLLPQHQKRSSSPSVVYEYVVLLMTIFRKNGPLWVSNTPDCSCSNNTKSTQVKQCREKMMKDVSHRDPKCCHNITGDSDDFLFLMACEVPAAADERPSHRPSYWKSMFNVQADPRFFPPRLTDLKMFNQLNKKQLLH